MRFERYECYKDSGLEWLGEIPCEWGVKRLKDLGYLQNGLSKSGSYFGFGFPFVSYGNIHKNAMDLKDIKGLANSTKEDQKMYSVLEGDVFFTRTSETVDEIGFSATCLKTIPKATFSGFVIRFRPRFNDLHKLYTKYLFRVHDNRHYFVKNMNIVTRASLNQGLLGELPTLIPPLKTQTKIATYLDTKTKKIDKEIALLEQKIEKYRELKQTLINETVLRGLDRGVEFKDSGIEWIGEIPEGWEVKRLKELVKNILSGATPVSNNEDYWINGVINWCNIKDMGRNKLLIKTDKKITQSAFISKNLKLIPKETILYSIYATLGRVNITKIETTINQAILAIFENKKKINKIYFIYYLEFIERNILLFANFNTQYNLNADIVKRLKIVIPPLKEQVKIANYLDEKTQKIDNITQIISKKIELLKEFRKTLINDVVTGKVKVA